MLVLVLAYIAKQAATMKPTIQEDYLQHGHVRCMPEPVMQQTAAWCAATLPPSCAGIRVIYVAWHYMPMLVHALKSAGMHKGYPPCPNCWLAPADVTHADGYCHTQVAS